MPENEENARIWTGEYCPIRGLAEKLAATAANDFEVGENEKCVKELCAWYDDRDCVHRCAIAEMGRAAHYEIIRGR